ncbi:hypothetical protein SAMN05421823_108236 [Catalinimonas alkaloidigena]|uniref:Outer membrane protein assembly factor BamA n=1 Tax=Catalinimonas alkaloidigena TaxID=1075417 RepID=A0A1G9NBA6_9BACT|nr:hypothetical protein [Catalinimonas alkaloidigena]SDL83663.1 hypothetical protein SAMN05421823_108236 [Catalinimonas alkaloidigena]
MRTTRSIPYFFILLGGLLAGLSAGVCRAQSPESPAVWVWPYRTDTILFIPFPDTLLAEQDSVRLYAESKQLQDAAADSLAWEQNREFYEHMQAWFYKRKVTRWIFDALFQNPGPVVGSQPVQPDPTPVSTYEQYNGMIIRRIDVQRLDVFGPSVNDTARVGKGFIAKLGNRLHLDTRRHVIRGDLLVSRGEPFDAIKIRDSERLLRQSSYLLDSRIIPITTEFSDSIDLLVVTQDVWTINAEGALNGSGGSLKLSDNNILGFAHQLSQQVSYSRAYGWGYAGQYRVPYVGRSLVTIQADFISRWDQKYMGIQAGRRFLTPSTRYAGNIEVGRQRLLAQLADDTTGIRIPYTYNLADMWLGRAFRFGFGSHAFRERARLVVAGRIIGQDFTERPIVREDTNLFFQHRLTMLGSIGYSDRSYYRDVLIYGFGRTEDVPYGTAATFTFGAEQTEFGYRPYVGGRFANGEYHDFGYFYWNIGAGSFFRQQRAEQAALDTKVFYFTPLMHLKRYQFRQFVTLRSLWGFNRFEQEWLEMRGISGITRGNLRGNKRVVANLESVLFTPYNLLGFRIALFGFADFGMVALEKTSLFQTPVYQGYGLGVRIRNEHLQFNTFQFRLAWYPNFPNNSIPLRTSFSGIPTLRLEDFDIGAPQILTYW